MRFLITGFWVRSLDRGCRGARKDCSKFRNVCAFKPFDWAGSRQKICRGDSSCHKHFPGRRRRVRRATLRGARARRDGHGRGGERDRSRTLGCRRKNPGLPIVNPTGPCRHCVDRPGDRPTLENAEGGDHQPRCAIARATARRLVIRRPGAARAIDRRCRDLHRDDCESVSEWDRCSGWRCGRAEHIPRSRHQLLLWRAFAAIHAALVGIRSEGTAGTHTGGHLVRRQSGHALLNPKPIVKWRAACPRQSGSRTVPMAV